MEVPYSSYVLQISRVASIIINSIESTESQKHYLGNFMCSTEDTMNIIEWLRLEGTFNCIQPQPLPWAGCPPPAQAAQGPSNLALGTSRDGAPTALWAAVPGPHHPLSEKFSPNILIKDSPVLV